MINDDENARNGQRERITDWKTPFKVASWNVRTLYKSGQAKTVIEEMKNYGLEILALQEMRWPDQGEVEIDDFTFLYSGRNDGNHQHGVGLCLSKRARRAMIKFEPIDERLLIVRMAGKWFNITIIVAYAPTNEAAEEEKDAFYERLQTCIEQAPKHDLLITVGDMNAKVGREVDVFQQAIGRESLHTVSNDNGIRLASLACTTNLVIGGTLFPHKDIHKQTWNSPDGTSHNQIDHILVNHRFRRSLLDVRAYRGADCDSDHNLLVAKFTIKLKIYKNPTTTERVKNYDTSKFKDVLIKNSFQISLQNRFSALAEDEEDTNTDTVEDRWKLIEQTIKEEAERTIGFKGKTERNQWFDDECRRANRERKEARKNCIQKPEDENLKEEWRSKCRSATRILRRKKRQHINVSIDKIDEDAANGNIREAYKQINKVKQGYQGRSKMIKDKNGNIIVNEADVIRRWEEHFCELLNRPEPESLTNWLPIQTAEIQVLPPTREEIKVAVKSLKNNKAPGNDNLPAELFKNGGEALINQLEILIHEIWKEERIPKSWNESVIIPLHKKNDKLDCTNYRGISLLQTGYKIFARILYNRLVIYSEEIIGEYQCGFRRNRSTTDHIFTIKQIMEKYWEYGKNLYQLFIDFKQAYDSIHRPSIWRILKEFGVPEKLIRLIQVCLSNTTAQVKISGKLSDLFDILSGLKQGCVLSVLLFNIVMEKITRTIINREEGAKLSEHKILNTTYADDVDILAEKKQDLAQVAEPFQHAAQQVGLQINFSKTKIMSMNRNSEDEEDLYINGNLIEEVDEFKYLGATLHNKNEMRKEILTRIASANKCYFSLLPIMKKRSLSKQLKLRVYNTIIKPVALYASETWTITKETEHRLLVFENTILRRISGPVFDANENTWRRRHNNELRAFTNQESIVNCVHRSKLRWAGHVARMDDSRLPKIVLSGKMDGRRPRGRPRKRWVDSIECKYSERTGEPGTGWTTAAQDRRRWRGLVTADRSQAVAQDPPE